MHCFSTSFQKLVVASVRTLGRQDCRADEGRERLHRTYSKGRDKESEDSCPAQGEADPRVLR